MEATAGRRRPAATPPRARRAARGCPAGARGTCARRSRARSAAPPGCRARPSPRAPRARACPAGSRPAASASRSRTRRSAPRSRPRRAAPSSRRSRTRRRRCAARARAPAASCSITTVPAPAPSARLDRLRAPGQARHAASTSPTRPISPQVIGSSKKRVVEERVAEDRGEREARRRAADRTARSRRNACEEHRADEPARRARARRAPSRPRPSPACCATRPSSAPCPELARVRVRALEPADADARTGWCAGDPDPVRDEARAAARRLVQPARRVVLERVPDLRLAPTAIAGEHGEREPTATSARQRQATNGRADHDRRAARRSSTARTRSAARARSRTSARPRRAPSAATRPRSDEHERRRASRRTRNRP